MNTYKAHCYLCSGDGFINLGVDMLDAWHEDCPRCGDSGVCQYCAAQKVTR
jgi:hypothetical protein